MRVVLASASPRRRQLLEWAGIDIDVRPAEVDESPLRGEPPVRRALRLARDKATRIDLPGRVVIGADTIVHRDGVAYDKPRTRDAARAHLNALRGHWHCVTTGVCVTRLDDTVVFEVTTEVRLRDIGDDELERYVQSGEPLDKAGAYAIQGRGGALVAALRGSWTNVMGLPVEETLGALRGRR